jgi:hypothetical protein
MSTLEKLNKLAEEAGYKNLPYHSIIQDDWGNKTSTTLFFDKPTQNAVKLKPIVAARVRDYLGEPSKVPPDYKGLVAVHRAAFSYGCASRMNNVAQLTHVLDRLINSGITDLINQVGFLHGMKITMQLPDGTYFRELTESTGYEFRISVIKE